MAENNDMQQMTAMDGPAKGGPVSIEAGPIQFYMRHRDLLNDQGVSLMVMGPVEGKQTELLRFDCFDQTPHYHYGPTTINERHNLDKTTAGNPIGWAMSQLRGNFGTMLTKAGAEDLAAHRGFRRGAGQAGRGRVGSQGDGPLPEKHRHP